MEYSEYSEIIQRTSLHPNYQAMLNYSEVIDRTSLPTSVIQLNQNFFVPANIISMILVPYGLYLTFTSFLCPTTCLPSWLPLAPLATYLGTNFNFLMGAISAVAAALHLGEAVQAYYLARYFYHLNPLTVILWTINVFFFGIFGFFPLAFPDLFYFISDEYCRLPTVICIGV